MAEWVTVENYPDDDLYPPENEIVLVDVQGEGVFPGRFNFARWHWEWVRIEATNHFSDDESKLEARIEHQRETYDPYVKRWMFFPPRKRGKE